MVQTNLQTHHLPAPFTAESPIEVLNVSRLASITRTVDKTDDTVCHDNTADRTRDRNRQEYPCQQGETVREFLGAGRELLGNNGKRDREKI